MHESLVSDIVPPLSVHVVGCISHCRGSDGGVVGLYFWSHGMACVELGGCWLRGGLSGGVFDVLC